MAGLQMTGKLGRGASTIVCRARRQGVDYALKILRDRVAYGEQRSVAFRREAAMLACVYASQDCPGSMRWATPSAGPS